MTEDQQTFTRQTRNMSILVRAPFPLLRCPTFSVPDNHSVEPIGVTLPMSYQTIFIKYLVQLLLIEYTIFDNHD